MVAVFVNEQGLTASPDEKGCVRVYQKKEDKWEVIQEIAFTSDGIKGIAEARRVMIEMVKKLVGCKVFVASKVNGQLYYVLEANGFESFEAEGKPEQYLDGIWEEILVDETSTEQAVEKSGPATYFEKLDKEGYYFLNLKKVLNLDCSISSKKLLIPYLQKKEFIYLEVICDHVPRWFESELKAMELKSETIHLKENEYKVIITV